MSLENFVKYLPQFKVVVCKTCQYCLLSIEVKENLYRKHGDSIDVSTRQEISKYIASLDLASHIDPLPFPTESILFYFRIASPRRAMMLSGSSM